MDSLGFPDWKKIGWHIGKRLKDILNPRPDESGPSREERRAQRSRDGHKGLVYFDDFDEVISWSIHDIDPIQQSNQPLLPRASVSHRHHEQPKTKVILCHDYHGGYHDYESVRPHRLGSDMYSCEHLQFVDAFIYFSHKLLCLPPPTWTNLLHRNGVAVLASLVIEPQTPDSEQLLIRRDGAFTVATQLAAMAEAFNFDGWLLNIEKGFPKDLQHWCRDLIDFIDELRRLLGPSKKLLWYDALTSDGNVCYQNGLTRKNDRFAQAAGALFTNYKWTLKTVAESCAMAEANGISTSDIFVGIDVWAQNTDMPGPPRVTYPRDGGGGTNTGLVSFVEQS